VYVFVSQKLLKMYENVEVQLVSIIFVFLILLFFVVKVSLILLVMVLDDF